MEKILWVEILKLKFQEKEIIPDNLIEDLIDSKMTNQVKNLKVL